MPPSRKSAAACWPPRPRCPRPEPAGPALSGPALAGPALAGPALSGPALAGALALLLLPLSPAHAHGGPHDSVDVGEAQAEGPADLATNYGLLWPATGQDWAWICEEVVGPQGFTSQLQVGGRWFLGSVAGLQASDDGCDWPLVGGGALDGLFVTSVSADVAVDDRLWVTTASGDRDNALWRSDDGGESFVAFATFGAGTALRGLGQGPGGLPLFVVGWDGAQPMAWISPDGGAWTPHLLPTDDVFGVAILGVADGAAWVRTTGAEQDRLARLDPDGSFSPVLDAGGVISAFDAGPAAGTLHLGARGVGLRTSLDSGETWGPPVASPAPLCLRTRGDTRWLCADDDLGGAAVYRTARAEGDSASWTWEPVMSYGQVRGPLACPADSDVARLCDPLWEIAAPEAGFDQDDPGPTDSGDGASDGGASDGGASPDPSTTGCCQGRAAGLLLLPPLWFWGSLRRQSRLRM